MFSVLGFLIRSFWPLLVVVILGNIFVPDPKFENLEEEAGFQARAGQYGRARNIYEELSEKHPYRLEYHRGYLQNHFRLPSRPSRHSRRDDDTPRRKYEELEASDDVRLADVGRYGLGFYYTQENNFRLALDWYGKITNRDAPFVNNSIGYVLRRTGRLDEAESYFIRELKINGNKSGAWSNLVSLYDSRGDMSAIERLLQDPAAASAVSPKMIRKLHYTREQWGSYWSSVLRPSQYTITGVLASSAIAMMWFIWLSKLDLYEPEDLWHKLSVLGASFALAETFATPAYDFYSFTLGFDLGAGAFNDFIYSVVAIGFIEETIKFIPFLGVLYVAKVVNESVDYIVYASLSGLGFALAENIGYLSPDGVGHTVGRALTSTVAHMALTTIAASGFIEAKYSPYVETGTNKYVLVAKGFALACVLHGAYDFFLVTEGFWAELAIVSTLVLLLKIRIFSKLAHSAINHSEFYDRRKGRHINLREHLIRLLLVVFSLQFLLMGFYYGRSIATWDLLGAVFFSLIIMFFLLVDLGGFQVQKGEWRDALVDD